MSAIAVHAPRRLHRAAPVRRQRRVSSVASLLGIGLLVGVIVGGYAALVVQVLDVVGQLSR